MSEEREESPETGDAETVEAEAVETGEVFDEANEADEATAESADEGTDDAADEESTADVADESAEDSDSDGEEPTADAADLSAEELAKRVAEHDEALAERFVDVHEELETYDSEVTELREQLEAREEQIEELEEKLKRKQADFQNYKKRQKKRREQLQERATEDLVERLVPVRDNLKRALEQEEGTDIREGVEKTLERFDEVLEEENVTPIEPAPGDEVDPQRHEVMMRVESDQPAGTVADLYRPGYEMGDKVVQAAQVTVSEGDEE